MKSRVNKFKVPRASRVKYKIIFGSTLRPYPERRQRVSVNQKRTGKRRLQPIGHFKLCSLHLKKLTSWSEALFKKLHWQKFKWAPTTNNFKISLKMQAFADPRNHQPYFFRCCWRTISKYFTFKTFSRYQAFTWKIAEKWKAVWLSRVGQGLPSLISPTFENREFNLLTPKPAITGRDGPGPFFYFWRHLFWPK